MIIDDINVTTKEGVKEFNEKHKGDMAVSLSDDGSISLIGQRKDNSIISCDPDIKMFNTLLK